MSKRSEQLEKQERLQRARNKIKLIRRQIDSKQTKKKQLLALVREYVSQRPEVTVQVIKKWIK